MSKTVDVAKQLRSWAAKNGILTYVPADQDDDPAGDLDDLAPAAEAQSAEQILGIRKINLIIADEETNTVIVYTQKNPTKKDQECLPTKLDGDVNVEFRKGALPLVRNSTGGPAPGGCSALHNDRYTCGSSVFVGNRVGAGTLGCLVKDANGVFMGLSNNHVTGGWSFSDTDLPITAPGTLDVGPGAPDPFTLGHHKSTLPLMHGSPDNANVSDNYDAAVFAIKDANLVSSMQRLQFDTPAKVASCKANTAVEKVGRTTGHTRGKIVGRAIAPEPVFVRIPEFQFSGLTYFEDFWVVEPLSGQEFARPGDSGSIICFRPSQGQPSAVGLLFAANTTKSLTYIAPLDKVLQKLGVSIVSGHNI